MTQITSARINIFPLKKTVTVLAIGFVAAACARTSYVGYDKETASVPGIPLRTVAVKVDDAYFSDFPDCTIIMPTRTAAGLEFFKPLVEEALGHHMTKKVSRVIGGTERDIRARRAALEVGRTEDRKELAEATGCKTLLYSRVVGPGHTYLVVWSQVQIGLEVVMLRAADGHVLWKARHIADRSDGGLPLSPIGLAVDTYSSTQFSSDREIAVSVVDDAVRRLVRSLPNARVYH
jgi:hypothetical protein